jgi:hypothetical protein
MRDLAPRAGFDHEDFNRKIKGRAGERAIFTSAVTSKPLRSALTVATSAEIIMWCKFYWRARALRPAKSRSSTVPKTEEPAPVEAKGTVAVSNPPPVV